MEVQFTAADLAAGECALQEFYTQFVNKHAMLGVVRNIPPEKVVRAHPDEHFDVSDAEWLKCNVLDEEMVVAIRAAGGEASAATLIGIAKAAALVLLSIAQSIMSGQITGATDLEQYIQGLDHMQLVRRDRLTPEQSKVLGDNYILHESDPFAGMSGTVH